MVNSACHISSLPLRLKLDETKALSRELALACCELLQRLAPLQQVASDVKKKIQSYGDVFWRMCDLMVLKKAKIILYLFCLRYIQDHSGKYPVNPNEPNITMHEVLLDYTAMQPTKGKTAPTLTSELARLVLSPAFTSDQKSLKSVQFGNHSYKISVRITSYKICQNAVWCSLAMYRRQRTRCHGHSFGARRCCEGNNVFPPVGHNKMSMSGSDRYWQWVWNGHSDAMVCLVRNGFVDIEKRLLVKDHL